MAYKEVLTAPNGVRVIGNLQWRLLDASHSVAAALRTTGGERSATHAATATANVPDLVHVGKKTKELRRVAGGFAVSSDGEGPGKKAHSLAAAFAIWTKEHPKAALAVRTPAGQHAVVVVLNGLPVLDKVVDADTDAYSLVMGYLKEHPEISVFADDLEKFPSSLMDSGLLDAIAAACSKATLIREIPVDVMKMALIGVLVLGAAAGYWYYSKHKAEEAKKLALERARAEDPVPKYLAALAGQRHSVGVKRQALVDAYQASKRIPSLISGWRLTKVSCSKESGCEAIYERTNGTYRGLKEQLDFMTLAQTGSMNLNEARLTWSQPLDAESIEPAAASTALDDFVQGSAGSTMQQWMVAGIGLQLQAPSLWPQVGGVPQRLKHAQALAQGKFDVANVALPLLEEVLQKAPANVVWSGFTIEIGDEKQDVMTRVKARVTGNYYVQN